MSKGEKNKALKKRIGTAARKARNSLGLTQEDAAEKIGVTVEFYSRIERGTALPSLTTFLRMALTFAMSTDALFGLNDEQDAPRVIKEYAAQEPDDPPELKRIIRRLRKATDKVLHFVNTLINELEKLSGDDKPSKKSKRGRRRSRSKDKGEDG